MNQDAEGLKAVNPEAGYRSHDGPHPVHDFLRPCLKVAVRYDRAVGYFTSKSLQDIEDGLDSLVKRGGTIRLITSPHLTKEDLEEIEAGYELRDSLNKAFARNLEELELSAKEELGYLGRLIRDNHLELRIAYMPNGGLYHEKIGFFADSSGEIVYFIGSNNATYKAQMVNHESFAVFCTWIDSRERERIQREYTYFEKLWNSQLEAVRVTHLSDVPKEILERCAQELPENWVPGRVPTTTTTTTTTTTLPQSSPPTLREYQKKAIAAWLGAANNGRGILKMATGSGKTFTASKAIQELRAKLLPEESLLVLITAPTKVLVEQWGNALKELNPLLCYDDVNQWYTNAESYIRSLRLGIRETVILVATEHTFGLEPLRALVDGWDGKLLFIADEVHGYASRTMRQRLPLKAVYRLGLSATPESKWQEHNEALFAYFDGIVFTYTLGEAIRDGHLSEYNYHPKIAVLTTEELEAHKKYSVLVAQFVARHKGPPPANHPDHAGFMAAVGKRDAVLDQCDSKIDLFQEAILQRSDSFFQLVYCGPGKSPLREISQFDQVKIYLAQTLGLSIHDFVFDTSTNLRPRILDDFGRGITIKVLVAKECLDEGVDIPDARIAYLLASSDDPRQWTQRRGRILRLPSTGTKTAEILDFLTLPPKDDSGPFVDIVKSEFQRALAFAADAKNSAEVNQQLDDWLTSYQMTRGMIVS